MAPPRFVAMCGGVCLEFIFGVGLFPGFLLTKVPCRES